MQEQGYSLQDFSGLIRRRGRSMILVGLGTVLLSIVAVYSLESLYRSAATIVIDEPEVSDRFLQGTYTSYNREQRIARINDDVMTRDNLAAIVETHNLYPEERGDRSPNSVVSLVRQNIELDLLMSDDDPRSREDGQIVGFEVAYFHPDPTKAVAVASDLVQLYLTANRERRQEAYLETSATLGREAESLRARVSSLESTLADFKAANPGALPEDRNYNRSVIERKARDLDGLDREIRSLQDRKTMLQSQLAQTDPWTATIGPDGEPIAASSERLRTLQAEYLRLIGIYSETHPDVVRIKKEMDAITGGEASPALRMAVEAQLQMKRAQLSDARMRYGQSHPDVINLERSVLTLETQLASMPDTGAEAPPPNNPIYVNLELQLQGVNNELAALRTDRRDLQNQTSELDRKVQVAPEVERQYLELTRDLDLAREQYEDIMSSQMAVERAGVLEEDELSERYVVTRSPNTPYKPAFPNRPLFIMIGVFLAITFSLIAGMSTEAFDGTIRSTRDIRTILDMPPIAAIPAIQTAAEAKQVKAGRLAYTIGSVVAIAAVAVYVQMQRTGAI